MFIFVLEIFGRSISMITEQVLAFALRVKSTHRNVEMRFLFEDSKPTIDTTVFIVHFLLDVLQC